MNALELTGRARTHIVKTDSRCALHVHARTAFLALRRAADAAGYGLEAVSAFREFDRQLAIWNGKFSGERTLLDATGSALDARALTPDARVEAILVWSALPGASRHHWGTDLDLIDVRAVPAGHKIALSTEEFLPGGPFAPLGAWLERHAARFGFFRPFRGILSGVQAEPWHFSFAPLSEPARVALTPALLRDALARAPLLGKEQVLARLEQIHARYVASVDPP